jgi:hypothetical protein
MRRILDQLVRALAVPSALVVAVPQFTGEAVGLHHEGIVSAVQLDHASIGCLVT